MELYEILDREACTLDLSERTKEEALRRIAEIASHSEALEGMSAEDIFQKLLGREGQGTTGFGDGIAIPHARMEEMKRSLMFIVTSRRGVDFEAMDKRRVHVFFVLLGPEGRAEEHLKILASISRLLSTTHLKNEILSAKSKNAIYEAFVRNSLGEDKKRGVSRKMKLMYVILYMQEFLYEILEFFIEEGVEGATIIDSSGMGQYISNIPLFASFIDFMREDKNLSKTIIALVPEDREEEIIRGIETITGDLDKKQGAMIITHDVSFYKGTMNMM